jgi:hypothetical protein
MIQIYSRTSHENGFNRKAVQNLIRKHKENNAARENIYYWLTSRK